MTSTLMRAACALAIAAALSACGGKAEFKVAGNIAGLTYDGLVLTSKGQELSVKANKPPTDVTPFSFANSISYGDEYAVVIKTVPDHQECALVDPVNNARGTAGQLASINVLISCGIARHTVGGTVKNLTSTGLIVINGSTGGGAEIGPSSSTTVPDVIYAVPPVPFGVAYGLTIFKQPLYDNCVFTTKASGTMGDNDIKSDADPLKDTGANISCTRVELGGGATGITAEGLVLKNVTTGVTKPVAKDATTFTFGNTGSLEEYDIQVAAKPAGLACTVTNGVKIKTGRPMPIWVTCAAG